MQHYTKLAFLSTERRSFSRLVQVIENQEAGAKGPVDVYLVGENAALLAHLQAGTRAVIQVATPRELPADVFLWYSFDGFWGTVHLERVQSEM